jgi:antitoxin component of MazEF toxin-antitoxin module
MIKTLRKQGNGQVLPLDKAILDAMQIDLNTPLQLTVTGNTLVVQPIHQGVDDETLDAAMKKMRARYGKTLKNLAK